MALPLGLDIASARALLTPPSVELASSGLENSRRVRYLASGRLLRLRRRGGPQVVVQQLAARLGRRGRGQVLQEQLAARLGRRGGPQVVVQQLAGVDRLCTSMASSTQPRREIRVSEWRQAKQRTCEHAPPAVCLRECCHQAPSHARARAHAPTAQAASASSASARARSVVGRRILAAWLVPCRRRALCGAAARASAFTHPARALRGVRASAPLLLPPTHPPPPAARPAPPSRPAHPLRTPPPASSQRLACASPACEREGGGGVGRGPAARARRAHPQMQLESTAGKKKKKTLQNNARALERNFRPFGAAFFCAARQRSSTARTEE